MPAVPIRPGRGVAGHALEYQAGRRPSDLLGVLRDDGDGGAPELAPVSVGVVNLQSTSGETTTQYLAAGSMLAVAPVVVLFALRRAPAAHRRSAHGGCRRDVTAVVAA